MYKYLSATVALAAFGLGVSQIAQNMYDWIEPQTAAAQVIVPIPFYRPWTAVGSTGAVDESSLPYFAFTNASAGYKLSPWVNQLEFRYNVTNTFDNNANPNRPGWTTLELGAQAPGTSTVEATLYRVNRCTGQQTALCPVRVAQAYTGTCKTCTVPTALGPVDFGTYLYYVRVALDRNSPGEQPWVHTLRVY